MTKTNKTLLIGTSKGLVVFQKTSKGWAYQTVYFLGMPVSMVYVDERNGSWWACLAHRHWGQKIHRSYDQGKTWEMIDTPVYPEDATLKSGKPATFRKVWSMTHAGLDRPDELYLGTEPGGLFYSKDGGNSFHLLESLWDHPSRKDEWFGAGRDHPFIHSIVVDPRDSNHYYIAVSCAGVFETFDNGVNWKPSNKGLIAAYLPNPHVEIGHDPHMMYACKANPDVIWQQNHCGIFRSTDGGQNWDNVTGINGFPDYGFALAIDDKNPDVAWVIPATSDEMRVAVDLSLCVCRTEDGGKTWQALRAGLPQGQSFDIVFRHAFDISGNTLAFGSTTGNVYLSEDRGNSWINLSHNLARVECVCFT